MTYNHEAYIRDAMDGIMSQKTDFPFQVVVGDDFSSDRTLEIIREYKSTDKIYIKILERKANDSYWVKRQKLGRLYNFSNILENCSGKYIALLDGDDYWTDPYKLQKQVDYLEKNEDCISSHHWHEYAIEDILGNFKVEPAPKLAHVYCPQEKTSLSHLFANKVRVMSRTHTFRNVINKMPDWFYKVAYGDVALSMILGQYGKFGFINEPMAVYRQTGKGVSTINKGSHQYMYNHFMNYIKLWEQGLGYYNYRYFREGQETILYFYSTIFNNYGFRSRIQFKCLRYCILNSPLPFRYRVSLFSKLSTIITQQMVKRIFRK